MFKEIKSFYYQFINFIQTMPPLVFSTIVLLTFAFCLVLVMKFFKAHNGTQKRIEKPSCLIWAIILFSIILYLTSIRF